MLAKQKGYMLSKRLFKKATDRDNVDPQKVCTMNACEHKQPLQTRIHINMKFQVIHHKKTGLKLILVDNIRTEKDVFTTLGLKYIKPQHRTPRTQPKVTEIKL
jgi:hypothetical protein